MIIYYRAVLWCRHDINTDNVRPLTKSFRHSTQHIAITIYFHEKDYYNKWYGQGFCVTSTEIFCQISTIIASKKRAKNLFFYLCVMITFLQSKGAVREVPISYFKIKQENECSFLFIFYHRMKSICGVCCTLLWWWRPVSHVRTYVRRHT